MLKLEQAGEALHKELNTLERSLINIKNKSYRYYYVLKAYYNKMNLPMDVFEIQKRESTKKSSTIVTKVLDKKYKWKK